MPIHKLGSIVSDTALDWKPGGLLPDCAMPGGARWIIVAPALTENHHPIEIERRYVSPGGRVGPWWRHVAWWIYEDEILVTLPVAVHPKGRFRKWT